MDEPELIGPSIEAVLNGILPEEIAQKRIELLREHAETVLNLRDIHRMMWQNLLGREVRQLVLDGFAPTLAEIAAKNNLAVKKQELDAELAEALERESQTLLQKMRQLMEGA